MHRYDIIYCLTPKFYFFVQVMESANAKEVMQDQEYGHLFYSR